MLMEEKSESQASRGRASIWPIAALIVVGIVLVSIFATCSIS